MAFASDTAVTHRVVATSGRRNARNERGSAVTSRRSLRRVLDDLLEGGPVDPGHGGHGAHTYGAELDVVELGVAPRAVALPGARVGAARVVGARAGPGGGIAAPVKPGELVDGGLERGLEGRSARGEAPLPAAAVAAAVDLGVAVADARVQRLSQRTLHVAFPTAVVGRSLRPGRVVQRIETGEQAEAVAVIAVRARREPRVEDRVHDARVELVHDRDGVALLVAA